MEGSVFGTIFFLSSVTSDYIPQEHGNKRGFRLPESQSLIYIYLFTAYLTTLFQCRVSVERDVCVRSKYLVKKWPQSINQLTVTTNNSTGNN